MELIIEIFVNPEIIYKFKDYTFLNYFEGLQRAAP